MLVLVGGVEGEPGGFPILLAHDLVLSEAILEVKRLERFGHLRFQLLAPCFGTLRMEDREHMSIL